MEERIKRQQKHTPIHFTETTYKKDKRKVNRNNKSTIRTNFHQSQQKNLIKKN